jgi:hypothetical protein
MRQSMSSRASTAVRSWPVMVTLEEEEWERLSLRGTATGSMAIMSSVLEMITFAWGFSNWLKNLGMSTGEIEDT